MSQPANVTTITYSRVDELDIQLDLHVPFNLSPGSKAALIFFHGGGMVTGGRKTIFFQKWLLDSTLKNDILFISADHRLLHPSTGFDIIADVKSLFTFLAAPDFSSTHLPAGLTLDTTRLAVVGESGGGYAASAAGIYAHPKPKVVLLEYAMGGQLLDDHWLSIKDAASAPPGAAGVTRESLLALLDEPQAPISYDPVRREAEAAVYPGYKFINRRSLLSYWLVEGELLDHVLGHEISHKLREMPYEQRLNAIPQDLRPALLQNQIDETFPPTFLLHGNADALILPAESKLTYERLKQLGVRTEIKLLEGAGHALMPSKGIQPGGPLLVDGAEEVQKKAWAFVLGELRA